jgi:hypothetical protein
VILARSVTVIESLTRYRNPCSEMVCPVERELLRIVIVRNEPVGAVVSV